MAQVTDKQAAGGQPRAQDAAAGPAWQTLSVDNALQQQGIDQARGLSAADAAARLQQYGPNTFTQAKKVPGWRKFLAQYQDTMQIVILVAAIVSGVAVSQWGTALILFAVTLFNALLGLRQEGKAEASMAALQKMMEVKTRVRRDGELQEISADQVVPGDIVVLEAGDRVPADGRIVKAATLEIAEAALTGESLPVSKDLAPVPGADTPLGDRTDMAYMNTEVTRGAGEILVTSTGMNTEVGHISDMLQSGEEEKTPLTKQLDALTNQLIIIAAGALILSMLIGRSRGVPRDLLFLTAIAFAVSAIPTGLPAVVTYLLAQGATALAASGAIMKRLRSVETLGSTSAINSDKTGTLTLNQMTAVEMVMPAGRFTSEGEGYSTTGHITRVAPRDGPDVDLKPYLMPMALCADAAVKDAVLVGDPTEGALVVLAAKGGIDPLSTREAIPRVAELPFDSAYKLMATFHRVKNEDGRDVIRAYVKGAPDQVLARCSRTLDADGKTVSIDAYREQFKSDNARLASQGLRVMSVARRDFEPTTEAPSGDLLAQITDLTMLALVGIVDPPRVEAKAAIEKAKHAGIQVRMITGDHAITAATIAKGLGIEGRAVTGAEFSALSDSEAEKQIDGIGVLARVTPEDKVRLVGVLKKKGHIVAMTGDGVNDAPALKKADIGVAMGITGTDVSKEAAVMILTDDNFATIVKAVERGRALYDNLLKYIRLQMGLLFGFIAIFLGAAIFNILDGAPFLPQQTLWVNFTVTVFLAIGLGLGAAASGIMDRKPRPADAKILPRKLMIITIILGLSIAISGLAAAQWGLSAGWGDAAARTIALTTFSLATIFLALECNDELTSVFTGDPFENGVLVKMAGYALLATFLVTEVDFMHRLFKTVDLDVKQWVVCLVAASLVMWVSEIIKFVERRGQSAPDEQPAAQPVAVPS